MQAKGGPAPRPTSWAPRRLVPEKNRCYLKKLSTFEMKELLHPSEVSVKCYIFLYLFITSNLPMSKRRYVSKCFSISFMKHFQSSTGMPLQGHLLAACFLNIDRLFGWRFQNGYQSIILPVIWALYELHWGKLLSGLKKCLCMILRSKLLSFLLVKIISELEELAENS